MILCDFIDKYFESFGIANSLIFYEVAFQIFYKMLQ